VPGGVRLEDEGSVGRMLKGKVIYKQRLALVQMDHGQWEVMGESELPRG
jgi:hypothetical protein